MEQPIVEFDNHYMLYITTFNDSNNPTGTYFYSSNNKLNEIFDNISNNNLNTNSHLENNARITDAKSDEDNDGINDKIIINYETSNNDVIEAKKKDIKLPNNKSLPQHLFEFKKCEIDFDKESIQKLLSQIQK